MGYWSKNQPENIVLPWIRKYGCSDFYVLFCLAALIFQHRQNFSPRGFLFPDRTDTLDRRPGPKSLRHLSLRSRFPVRPSCMLQEERPLASRISRLILTLSSRGFVFPDRLNTLDRRPRPKSLSRAGRSCRFWIWVSSAAGGAHRFLCISWHRLTLFARGFVSMHEKIVFDTMHGKLNRFLEN